MAGPLENRASEPAVCGTSTPSSPPSSHVAGNGRGLALHPLKLHPTAGAVPSPGDFEDVCLEPPPAAILTASPTHYDPGSPTSAAPQEGHQRSLSDAFFSNCKPLVSRAASTFQNSSKTSLLPSPTKSLATFIPSRSTSPGDDLRRRSLKSLKPRNSTFFGELFNGSSAPVNIGVVPARSRKHPSLTDDQDADDEEEEEYDEEDRREAEMFSKMSAPRVSRTATCPTAGSKFSSWLMPSSTKLAPTAESKCESRLDQDDELLNLSVPAALHPYGPADPLDPSSYHDLSANAEGLLKRYQTAYRKVSAQMVEVSAEQSAQADELNEAETRARHLKMQLDDMAERSAAQAKSMEDLRLELQAERVARCEEDEARIRSLTLVRGATGCSHREHPNTAYSHDEVTSSPNNPLRSYTSSPSPSTAPSTPCRKRNNGDSYANSDSGFESDHSSVSSVSLGTTGSATPSTPTRGTAVAVPIARPALQKRPSTYDQVLRGIDMRRDLDGGNNCKTSSGRCASCGHGKPSTAAWSVVARVQEENRELKGRVVELEGAVGGALELVAGLGI